MNNKDSSKVEVAPLIVITDRLSGLDYWKELWERRELLILMVWRDIIVRYKQTLLGAGWAFVRPLATMMVFTLIFGKFANLPSNNAPYALMVFAGLLPWQFFSAGLSDASNSVIGNSNLVTKVYFPRLLIPMTSVVVGLVDFFLAFVIYLIISVFFKFAPSLNIFMLPIFVLELVMLILGCSLWVSALGVWNRDFRHYLPVVLQLGAYLSPVGFASSIIPEKWALLYAINPMVGVIDGFRWALLGDAQPLRLEVMSISMVLTISIFITGLIFFRRNEHHFSDAI